LLSSAYGHLSTLILLSAGVHQIGSTPVGIRSTQIDVRDAIGLATTCGKARRVERRAKKCVYSSYTLSTPTAATRPLRTSPPRQRSAPARSKKLPRDLGSSRPLIARLKSNTLRTSRPPFTAARTAPSGHCGSKCTQAARRSVVEQPGPVQTEQQRVIDEQAADLFGCRRWVGSKCKALSYRLQNVPPEVRIFSDSRRILRLRNSSGGGRRPGVAVLSQDLKVASHQCATGPIWVGGVVGFIMTHDPRTLVAIRTRCSKAIRHSSRTARVSSTDPRRVFSDAMTLDADDRTRTTAPTVILTRVIDLTCGLSS